VQVTLASSAGRAGRANEDFVGAVPGAVVLLDGAGIPGAEAICSHGVAWYAHRLGGALLGRLSRGDGQELAAILAGAIGEIADDHRDSCDIADVSSPQATVAMVRGRGDRLDYLVLADSFLVLERVGGEVEVITDGREVAARDRCVAALEGVPEGTAEYERLRESCVERLRGQRNQPGGYWIAKDDPRVAYEAVSGSRALGEVGGVALLSNGASRIVRPYGVSGWSGVVEVLRGHGPAEVIRWVREVEAGAGVGGLAPDDATVAYCARVAGMGSR
jgi:hypothetical protein